jgi:serine/threonine-protein kinase
MSNLKIGLLDDHGEKILKQWQFVPPNSVNIGRSPDNQIIIDRPLVSRLHATIAYTKLPQGGGYWQLTNRGTNGTFVNNIPASQVLLTNGDRIQLAPGGAMLTVELVTATANTCQHQGNKPGSLFCIHCGQPITVVKTVHNYQIIKILGQGGMGTTYLAWDGRQLLVLKEMNADLAQIPKAKELFEREAKILQSLHHAGIPKYYDFFVAGDRKYLAMELIHGVDLERYILTKGTVNLAQAIEWMRQLCEILTYIHSAEPPLIHRDIKPANLLVRNTDRRVFLIDFGAVKEIGTPGGTRIGAPDYMAPEQNQGQPRTQSDLYAIGPTLIFLLTGQNPTDFLELTPDGYRFNISHLPKVTPQLQKIIDKVTQRRISDRYQTAAELSQALATVG